MQARVKLGLALLAAVFSGSVVAVQPALHGQNTNAGPVDVAKTPAPPNPAVPTPYPNTVHGMGVPDSQKEGSKTRVQGETVLKNKSSFKHSAGDEAGSRAQAAAGKGGAAGPGATGVASAAGEAGALAAPFVPGGAVVSAAVSGSGGAAAGAGAEGSAGGAAAVIPPVAKTPTPGGPPTDPADPTGAADAAIRKDLCDQA